MKMNASQSLVRRFASRCGPAVLFLAWCAVAAALPSRTRGQQAVSQPLALQGQPAPGAGDGVRYGLFSFYSPLANDAGATSFTNGLTGTGVTDQNDRAAFFRRPDGSTVLYAREGTAAPGLGTGVLFREVYDVPVLNDSGNVALFTTLRGTGVVFDANDSAVFTGPTNALVPLARRGGPASGMGAGVVHAHIDPALRINEPGQVAYRSILAGTGVTPANSEALFVATPASTTLAARRGDPAPGMAAGVTYGTFRNFGDTSFDLITLNDAGHLA
jgi:hypothetical protein